MNVLKTILFYLAVVLIVVVAVFPFYYAIVTSFKTGTYSLAKYASATLLA